MNKEIDNIERLINDKNVEFRDFKLTKIETRKNDDDTESLVIEGVPCVFDTETVLYKGKYWEFREKIDKDAFKEADMTDVIFNYNHHGRVFARTRNKSLELEVKKDGLHMKATLKKEDRGHEELYSDIQSGLIDKMSFAFTVKESKIEEFERSDEPNLEIRTITKIDKLYDVSAVDIPAYDTTSISARKTFNAESKEREAESLKNAMDRRKKQIKLKLMLEA
jgi:uncharacterized protein